MIWSFRLPFISFYYCMSVPYLPSLKCTPPHVLLISLYHNVADQLFFISSYYVSILSQPCSPHLLCNVYHSTYSSDLFIPSCRWSALLHLFILCVHTISALLPSSTLHVYHSTYSSDLFIPSCRWSALLHLFILCVHTISALLPSSTLQCLPLLIFFWSLHPIMSLISSPSSLHIMCPYYLSLAPLIYSAMSTTPHILLISSSHHVADQLSFISSYYVSILSQPCSPHLLCNVYHSTYSSDLFIPSCRWSALLHLFILCVHTISALLPSSTLQCLPLHIFFWSLHPIMSLISSPSSLHIMCPYYLSLAPLIYSAMSTTLHIRLISSSHHVADQLSFISSYYVSILSQPCSPHLLCNVYHSSYSSDLFIPSCRWSALLHLFLLCVHTISALLPSYTLHVYHSTYSSDLFIPSCRWPALLHLFLLCVHTISALLPSSTLQCLPLYMSLWSLNPIMSLISSPSSLLIMCPYYLSLASLIYSAMSTTPHILLISSSHHVADQLSFISSYYVSILSQPCSPHLLCNVYHSTCPCDLLIPSCRWSALLHLFLLCVHTISALLPSSTLQCLPLLIFFWSLHPIMSLISSPSSLLIMCPYYLNLPPLIYSAMSTTLHVLVIS